MRPTDRERRRCSVPGCGEPSRGRGLCEAHYQQARRNGSPQLPARPPCSVPGCEEVSWARGLCMGHYREAYRSGSLAPKSWLCAVPGCGRPSRTVGLCWMHFSRFRRGRPLDGGRLP